MDDTLSWLHAELFRPVEPWLRSRRVRRLLVVPHRGLHLLPVTAWWSANRRRRRYVADDYEVCFAPSLTLLQICAERSEQASSRRLPGRPLALLDPTEDLPLTRLDAVSLGTRIDPDRIFAGRAATVGRWRTAGADAGLVHYAGHAEYHWPDPLESGISLADGGLTLGEMFDAEIPLLPAAEICLSGCETAMTDPRDPADEYLGLAGGLLFSGAASVLSTLWAVQEAPAMLLFTRYYDERRRGTRPSAALRAAQRWLRHAGRAELRGAIDRTDDLGRLGLLDESFRARLPYLRETVGSWRHASFTHPSIWAAYTVTGGFTPASDAAGS
jgi:CHAT domain-containing protein